MPVFTFKPQGSDCNDFLNDESSGFVLFTDVLSRYIIHSFLAETSGIATAGETIDLPRPIKSILRKSIEASDQPNDNDNLVPKSKKRVTFDDKLTYLPTYVSNGNKNVMSIPFSEIVVDLPLEF